MPHVTVSGAIAGHYLLCEQRPDGTLVLAPETAAHANLRRCGARPATPVEFAAFVTDHREYLLAPDDEG